MKITYPNCLKLSNFHSLLVLLIFYSTDIYTQTLWFWQNPKPQGNHLFNIQFVNSNTAFAAGGSATILKTTDSGETWSVTHNIEGTTKILKDLFFLDANNGWAGGYDGKLLHTTDGGVSWDSISGHTYKIIEGISFANNLKGTIVSAFQHTNCCGSIYQTSDGGVSWVNRPQPPDAQDNLHDLSFANEDLGIAVGLNGIILKTTNGGSDWLKQNSSTLEQLYTIDNYNENTWIVAGNGGIILRSTNGGISWTQQLNGTTFFFQGLDLVDQNTGYVCGADGAIYKTTDGGITWQGQQSGTINHLFDISFSDADTGIAVGLYGTIVRTTNGGNNWHLVSEGTIKDLNDIEFPTTQTGYICGDEGTLLKTTNFGAIWENLSAVTSQELFDISFSSSTTGTAVGASGTIIRTTNAGLNWTHQFSGISGSGSLNGVTFINDLIGFAAGYTNGGTASLLKTTNGGANWTNLPTGITNLLYAIDFLNENNGIAVGGMGAIIVTTNSGSSWVNASIGQGYVFSSVTVLNNNFAAAGGYDSFSFPVKGTVFISTDGGINWINRSAGLNTPINKIWFQDENNGIAAALNGEIFRTTNGGINWLSEHTGTDNNIYGISVVDADNTILVGEGGTILTSNASVPVELSSFTGIIQDNNIILNWSTSSETNNKGFEIERRSGDREFEKIGYAEGFGTTTEPKSYSFTDYNISPGTYIYRLKQIDYNGSFEYSNSIDIKLGLPLEFSISQNYPNPFNPFTVIQYQVPFESKVKLSVYDMLGRETTVLLNEEKSAGIYQINFDASDLSSGIYFYRLIAINGERILYDYSRKMIILK